MLGCWLDRGWVRRRQKGQGDDAWDDEKEESNSSLPTQLWCSFKQSDRLHPSVHFAPYFVHSGRVTILGDIASAAEHSETSLSPSLSLSQKTRDSEQAPIGNPISTDSTDSTHAVSRTTTEQTRLPNRSFSKESTAFSSMPESMFLAARPPCTIRHEGSKPLYGRLRPVLLHNFQAVFEAVHKSFGCAPISEWMRIMQCYFWINHSGSRYYREYLECQFHCEGCLMANVSVQPMESKPKETTRRLTKRQQARLAAKKAQAVAGMLGEKANEEALPVIPYQDCDSCRGQGLPCPACVVRNAEAEVEYAAQEEKKARKREEQARKYREVYQARRKKRLEQKAHQREQYQLQKLRKEEESRRSRAALEAARKVSKEARRQQKQEARRQNQEAQEAQKTCDAAAEQSSDGNRLEEQQKRLEQEVMARIKERAQECNCKRCTPDVREIVRDFPTLDREVARLIATKASTTLFTRPLFGPSKICLRPQNQVYKVEDFDHIDTWKAWLEMTTIVIDSHKRELENEIQSMVLYLCLNAAAAQSFPFTPRTLLLFIYCFLCVSATVWQTQQMRPKRLILIMTALGNRCLESAPEVSRLD